MERPADLQRQAALCAGGHCCGCGFVHRRLVAADDQLPGAVVVADLHNTRIGSGIAAGLQRRRFQSQNSGHSAGTPRRGSRHRLAAKRRQADRRLHIEHSRARQRGIFPQGQPRRIVRHNARLPQHGGNTAGKRRHTGLGVLGFVQYARRIGEHNFLYIKIHRSSGLLQHSAESGEVLIQVLAHTGVLAALPGV